MPILIDDDGGLNDIEGAIDFIKLMKDEEESWKYGRKIKVKTHHKHWKAQTYQGKDKSE